jgi:hypothetical protein
MPSRPITDSDRNESGFDALRAELLESGVAPRHVRRIVAELDDHLDDLCREARLEGMSETDARDWAMQRIGDQRQIARRMLASADLRAWVYRYPKIARWYLPVAYALLLPAYPVFAGIANAGIVLRWSAALMLSAGVTAGMMLILQLAIATT